MANTTDSITLNSRSLSMGLNLDSVNSQIQPGGWSWALNAVVEGFDGNIVTLQNEQGNTLCVTFPVDYKVIGAKAVFEKDVIIVMLCKAGNTGSEIGLVDINTCIYTKSINADCLGFRLDKPILKIHVKITNCSFEAYWTDAWNERRFIDFYKLPFKEEDGPECDVIVTTEIDCNKLRVQPDFKIPQIAVEEVSSDGELLSGAYQFAVQYSNAVSEGYTSYYSITNPLSIFDSTRITPDFNLPVNKSIVVTITGIDTTGYYDYFNLAVLRTVNNITTPTLVGTYLISDSEKIVHYTGQNKEEIKLTPADIFEKYPIYERAGDSTTVQDILIWDDLVTNERLNYQKIWSNIHLQWQTNRIRNEKPYLRQENVVDKKGYFRDEVYALEGVFLLKNGYQTDRFHIPGRIARSGDLEIIYNGDVVDNSTEICVNDPQPKPRWQVYSTGNVTAFEQEYLDTCSTASAACDCYEGPYQYGDFSYWESTDTYPCREDIWGDLAGKPIRHHKFPDSTITHIHDTDAIYPIGIKINVQELIDAINNSDLTQTQKDNIQGFKITRANRANNKSIVARGLLNNVGESSRDNRTYYYPNYPYNDLRSDPFIGDSQSKDDESDNDTYNRRLRGFVNQGAKRRFTLHSPDTSFYQPGLGNILKLETAIYGKAQAHFQQVKKHARYKFLTLDAYHVALDVAVGIGVLSASLKNFQVFNGTAAMAAFSAMISIIEKLIPRQNFAYQYNSIGNYDSFFVIPNNGNKIRRTDLAIYAIPGMLAVGDDHTLNNFQRESSVYLRTIDTLPFPSEIPGVPVDESRFVLSEEDCINYRNIVARDISSYYATLKKNFSNQYGQIYSYESVDTGFQEMLDLTGVLVNPYRSVFGGDCFINKFAYKSKIPFFIDNRVNFPDDADVFYNEIGNVGYPLYWFSTDSRGDGTGSGGTAGGLKKLFGVKINNFDCPDDKFFWQDGKIYLFAYGIPYFFCESQVNVDLRQAFNDKEGDFFPHVSSDIPDEWFDEIRTTIQFDNTYTYNKSYSKQNDENFFSHLPEDFSDDICRQNLPFRAIYSEQQLDLINYRRNNWLIYRPVAKFDFPQNFGKLTSLDGIENKAVLARFENKTQLYNTLLTINTSNPQAAYLGNDTLFKSSPPIDYADTDLGYIGSQHKFLLKTEYGHLTGDAKRGQFFLLQGQQARELSNEGLNKFFIEFLPFAIQKAYPDFPLDNHFNGCGLHGTYDPKYDRIILTKIDYQPLNTSITWDGEKFMLGDTVITLGDPEYFCSNSFTISYSFKINGWVAFHKYIPNYYVGTSTFFYSGNQNGFWKHNTSMTLYNTFYGVVEPYIIEYPYSYKIQDEILQCIKDYTKVLQYTNFQSFIETDDYYFNKAIVYSNQQCSGVLNLIKRPKGNLQAQKAFPVYNSDSKDIMFTKSDSLYQFNTFWDLVKDHNQPIWLKSCVSVSDYKELNQNNMSYSKRAFKKAPIRSKELRIRFINDLFSSFKFISSFTIAETMKSYK